MIVKNPPPGRPSLHDQGEGTARGDGASSPENEARRHQSESGTQRSRFHLFEVQAVSSGTRREPAGVVVPDEVYAVPSAPAVDESRRAIRRVVGQKSLEVTPIPVVGSPVQLRNNFLPEGS